MRDLEVNITPSVLDRLFDDRPDQTRDEYRTRAQKLRDLKASVLRDLSALLNTKRPVFREAGEFKNVASSVVLFGLPDFVSFGMSNPANLNKLRKEMELAIKRFEPRLDRVSITLIPRERFDLLIQFRIEALLLLDPEPEPISFDTIVERDNVRFVMTGETA